MQKKNLTGPLLLFFVLFAAPSNGFALSIIKPIARENRVLSNDAEYLKASVFVKLSVNQFETITGKKLNLPQRIYFKIVQRRLRRELKKNPDVLITSYYDPGKTKFKFDALWFVIAAFIGPLGVLAAYTSKQRKGGPNKKDKITSAWLGFAFFVLWFGYIFVF